MEQQIKEFETLNELLDDLEREGITGIDRRRHMGNFLMRKSRLHGRPYCASFELTPLCNFDCKMCYMHLTQEQLSNAGRILTTAQWLEIAHQAVEAGVASVDLTGGECLTHPGFEEIYRYLAHCGVQIAVLTNGQLITERIVKLFTHYPPAVVQISLYGSNPDAYKRVTGRDAFAEVMNAIKRLKSAGIRVKLSVTPNRFMQDDARAMLDLLHSLNVDYTIGTTTLPARPETGREIADYIVDNEAYINICKLETQHRARLEAAFAVKPSKPYQFRIKGQETFQGTPCASGAANFHINWKGEMMPCVAFYTVSKPVLEEGLEAAWVWIRETMRQYHSPAECNECDLHDSCVGCPAEKTAGILNGPVNTWVCKRQRATVMTALAQQKEKKLVRHDEE